MARDVTLRSHGEEGHKSHEQEHASHMRHVTRFSVEALAKLEAAGNSGVRPADQDWLLCRALHWSA